MKPREPADVAHAPYVLLHEETGLIGEAPRGSEIGTAGGVIDLTQMKSLLSLSGRPLEPGDDAARPPYMGQHDGGQYPVAVIDGDEPLGRTAGGPILLAYTGASCHPGPGTPGTGWRMLDWGGALAIFGDSGGSDLGAYVDHASSVVVWVEKEPCG